MTILYLSDFDLRGSGYMNIGVALCEQLAKRGYDVLALGMGYKGQEHTYPFSIVPAQFGQLAPMVRQLQASNMEIEAVVVALDVPLQEKILQQLDAPCDLPYVGLFPLEAGPVCGPWAASLLRMDVRLIMSEFGQKELASAGVDSEFIIIGVDTESWRPPFLEERQKLRQGLGVEDETFVVLTVADNQERKNLSRTMEIFADFAKDKKAAHWMVTRPGLAVGWKLEDYAMKLGSFHKTVIWERGMEFKQLWSLYAAADAFLLTSKAEGLAMPILEAMATRLPAIGTKCAAIEEHLSEGRGILISSDYVMIDPWGNSRRYFADREDGTYKLRLLQTGMDASDKITMLDAAQIYVKYRTWDKAGDVLEAAIKKAVGMKGQVVPPVEIVRQPERIMV